MTTIAKKLQLLSGLVIVFFLTNCSAPAHVQRVSETSVTDLSGRWNETDSRLTGEQIGEDLLSNAWYSTFTSQNQGKAPIIIVGLIVNKSHEHIASETFELDIEKAIINSGKMKLVQSGNMREEVRAERADQQNYSSQQTMKKFGLEHGADFMLTGTINSIVDEYSREKTIFYQIDLQLTNIQTNEKVWIGDKKIKKYLGNKKK
ncbi:MAG TPA: penicillin-binding protein activator LpoB [Mucilaginibacter sp.]|nr:penicillin-binding protein activator LpoB [Mucilaginibacter sp.]